MCGLFGKIGAIRFFEREQMMSERHGGTSKLTKFGWLLGAYEPLNGTVLDSAVE